MKFRRIPQIMAVLFAAALFISFGEPTFDASSAESFRQSFLDVKAGLETDAQRDVLDEAHKAVVVYTALAIGVEKQESGDYSEGKPDEETIMAYLDKTVDGMTAVEFAAYADEVGPKRVDMFKQLMRNSFQKSFGDR